MNGEPSLLMWEPTLSPNPGKDSVVTLILTPVESTRTLVVSANLCMHLLERLQIDAIPKSWAVRNYRCSYHGLIDMDSEWPERWPENWKLAIHLDRPVSSLRPRRHEYSAVFTGGEWSTQETGFPVACVVFSDFDAVEKAQRAERAILDSYASGQGIKHSPKFTHRKTTGDLFHRLEVDLGEFDRIFYEMGAPDGVLVENICKENLGLTSFYERANEWDEYFNPDGLE